MFRKKEKNDEINMLTARIIALRNELRKYAKKGGGNFCFRSRKAL